MNEKYIGNNKFIKKLNFFKNTTGEINILD